MTKLFVDLNRVDESGRIPALIPEGADPASFTVGAVFELDDREGTILRGRVDEVRPGGVILLVADRDHPLHYDAASTASR